MMVRGALRVALIALALSMAHARAQVRSPVAIDADDIGGGVTSTRGPEAGVCDLAPRGRQRDAAEAREAAAAPESAREVSGGLTA
ncbi:MAG TPA: hypothetical protein VGJ78_01730 [Vicinamibacterales bacterium]|jgi:hypothetical protein